MYISGGETAVSRNQSHTPYVSLLNSWGFISKFIFYYDCSAGTEKSQGEKENHVFNTPQASGLVYCSYFGRLGYLGHFGHDSWHHRYSLLAGRCRLYFIGPRHSHQRPLNKCGVCCMSRLRNSFAYLTQRPSMPSVTCFTPLEFIEKSN